MQLLERQVRYLPIITLQGVCHVYEKMDRRRACRPAGALRAAGRGRSPTHPAAQTADVAILMYHAFTEDEADTGSLYTPASEFARQLSALRDAGYTSVAMPI